ncbi:MAG: OsmC family protein [Gemmatimonadetes bacterium]|nr:OsmC family protein [Gemmatimonadota bacterium]
MSKVTVELGEGTMTRLEARSHVWVADEPAEARGTDQGPNPYELLLGSLGACTVLTLRFYAHRKGWPLESVRAEYDFSREYARDCRECQEDGDARLDVIRSRIVIRGRFDDAQRARLTEIAGRCPVHRTLDGGPQMFETVEFEDGNR